MPNLVGRTLAGRYRVEDELGSGAMSTVYKAWDTRRLYHVALKVLRQHLAEDLDCVRRCEREARCFLEQSPWGGYCEVEVGKRIPAQGAPMRRDADWVGRRASLTTGPS